MTGADPQRLEILLVDDSPADVRLTQEALRDGDLPHRLHVAEDGEEAIEFLRRGRPRPHVVLLDLNLPGRDGHEVLAEIRADRSLSALPVIVLTGSHADEDVLRSWDLHATGYVTKPVNVDELVGVLREVEGIADDLVRLLR